MPDPERRRRGRDGLGGTGRSAAGKWGPEPPSAPVLTTKGLVEALATLNPEKGNPEGGNGEWSVRGWMVYIIYIIQQYLNPPPLPSAWKGLEKPPGTGGEVKAAPEREDRGLRIRTPQTLPWGQ